MFLPNVAELITTARQGLAPETVFGPDRPRMAARLFEARDTISALQNGMDWGSEAYATLSRVRAVLTEALISYPEYADWGAAHARACEV